MTANVGSMMYAGAVPWHGLGKKVEREQTAGEAIIAAGLDWAVEKRQLFFRQDRITNPLAEIHKSYDNRFAVVRTDNETPLGIVAEGYHLVQNRAAFSLMDAVVGEAGAHYHTAGCLGNGEIIWLLVKLPGYLRVAGDDTIEKYILLVNSHDGTYALRMLETPIRVVCQNTLTMALEKKTNSFRQKHDLGIKSLTVKQVREALGYSEEHFDVLEQMSQLMAKRQMALSTTMSERAYFKKVIEYPKDQLPTDPFLPAIDMASTRMKNRLDDLLKGFEVGRGADLDSARGTVWGAYNAVVEYVDYGMGSNDARRAKSSLFGSGARMKLRAWELAKELVA